MTVWHLPAPAKLNLVLRVVGRRADGYHLLETLFHALALHDDLWLGCAAEGVQLHITAERPELLVPDGPDNLVQRALRQLQQAAGTTQGFRVHLHKRIPHGGGLGGGSSDAAAALRLGNAALGGPLAEPALARLASGLGADVAFFLRGGSQWGRGIGDELTPAEVPPLHFVLVLPPFGCPTASVYKIHAALWNGGRPQASVTASPSEDTVLRMAFANDLEPAAEQVRPELAELRRRVAALGYPQVRMTGSGSTLFVAHRSAVAAAQCAADLQGLTASPPQGMGVTLVSTASERQPTAIRAAGWPTHWPLGSSPGPIDAGGAAH
jgi:4-diphosphocytidyl-2-C-methyl-D-erythritol kinase